MRDVLNILFGWFLGLASTYLWMWVNQQREKRGLIVALLGEIRDTSALVEQLPAADYRTPAHVLGESYFSVFDSNASKLSSLNAADGEAVRAYYAAAKDYFDRLRSYRNLHDRWGGTGGPIVAQVEEMNIKLRRTDRETVLNLSRQATARLSVLLPKRK